MIKEIRENVEITIYTEAEKDNVQTEAWYVGGSYFNEWVTKEDHDKVEQAKAERLAREQRQRLARTEEELEEIKKEIERLEHAKFIEEMADRLDRNSYDRICRELSELKKIVKANKD